MEKYIKKWRRLHFLAYRKFIKFVGSSKESTSQKDKNSQQDRTSKSLFRLFQVAIYFVICILMINLVSLKISNDVNFGTFGDFFGGVLNPILTFLMFMGVLITIILQQKELRLTRQELSVSSKALSDQALTLDKQRFEETFFSLLNQHNIILDKIIVIGSSKSNKHSLVSFISEDLFDNRDYNLEDSKKVLLNYNDFVNQYFRVLYQALKLIAISCPTSTVRNNFVIEALENNPCSEDEKSYSNIVRSFLPVDVYRLLAVNCYCVDKNDSFILYKCLIERYSFLEHMYIPPENNRKRLVKAIISHYSKIAFDKNIHLKI